MAARTQRFNQGYVQGLIVDTKIGRWRKKKRRRNEKKTGSEAGEEERKVGGDPECEKISQIEGLQLFEISINLLTRPHTAYFI